MSKVKGLSFKKEAAETGLRAIASPYGNTQIKFKKKQVGRIVAPSRFGFDTWRVALMVKVGNDFTTITFKAKFLNEPDARIWVQEKWEIITAGRELYELD